MFSNSKKIAQQAAQRLIAGHYTLLVWWAVRHAGVFEAMLKLEEENGEGLDVLVFATRTNMSAEVLGALLDYLSGSGLVETKPDGRVHLSAEGRALLEHEDGVLEMVRAYEPVMDMVEHVLAKLKPQGGGVMTLRKTEALVSSQAARYGGEVYPAVEEVVRKNKLSHVLDLACGSGDLLIHLATHVKNVVGIGVGNDGILVRQANAAITRSELEKRLIAVTAGSIDVCMETRRVFDRIGISGSLWEEIDCIVAVGLAAEVAARENGGGAGADAVVKVLGGIAKNFPKAHLLLVEPTDTPRLGKNYYAGELSLLLRLTKCTPWTPAVWRETLGRARYGVVQEVGLVTDGLTVFVCRPA